MNCCCCHMLLLPLLLLLKQQSQPDSFCISYFGLPSLGKPWGSSYWQGTNSEKVGGNSGALLTWYPGKVTLSTTSSYTTVRWFVQVSLMVFAWPNIRDIGWDWIHANKTENLQMCLEKTFTQELDWNGETDLGENRNLCGFYILEHQCLLSILKVVSGVHS